MENGLVQPHGQGRGRAYTLSPEIYRAQGEEVASTRQAGFSRIQRKEVMELCHLSPDQAYRLLKRLVDEKKLKQQGTGNKRYYTLP